MKTKKALSLLLAAAAVFGSAGLAGCGKKDTGPVYSRRTNVYKTVELTQPDNIEWIEQAVCTGDAISLLYTRYVEVKSDEVDDSSFSGFAAVVETVELVEEVVESGDVSLEPGDGYTTIAQDWIYTVQLDGSGFTDVQVNFDSNVNTLNDGYLRDLFSAEDGMLYAPYSKWNYTETTSWQETVIYTLDPKTGNVGGDPVTLTSAVEAAGFNLEEVYINKIGYTEDGFTFVVDNCIVFCDKNGVFQKKLETSASWINSFYVDGDTAYYTSYVDGTGYQLFSVDMSSGSEQNMTTDNLAYVIGTSGKLFAMKNGKFYFRSSNDITSWDRTTDTATEEMNFLNCDIDRSMVDGIFLLEDGKYSFYGSEYTNGETQYYIGLFERIPDEEMQDEIILTMAGTYTDYSLRKAILRFNKQNSGVRISLKDYSKYNNEENDWNGAGTQLNNDMTIGNTPDILMLDTALPVKNYYRKGVFVDLYSFLDAEDSTVNRTDLLENILSACEHNGKLYSIITSYYVKTLTAKTSYVGAESGWTLREMLDVVTNLPEGMEAFSYDFGRDTLQEMLVYSCMDSFVNWETGETHFDSQEFIDLIEYLKTCPEASLSSQYYDSVDYDNYDAEAEREWYANYEMRFYLEKALFLNTYISGFSDLLYTMQNFGGDATVIGYPTDDEGSSGAVVYPNVELAICAASKNVESAWTFLEYLLTDEQFANDNYNLSISKTTMQDMLEETNESYANNEYYGWSDEDYSWYEQNYSEEYVKYLKNTRLTYSPEIGQMVMDIVTTATTVVRYDDKLYEIINEELSSFYGGTKSAADTANVINSRARIYISENS